VYVCVCMCVEGSYHLCDYQFMNMLKVRIALTLSLRYRVCVCMCMYVYVYVCVCMCVEGSYHLCDYQFMNMLKVVYTCGFKTHFPDAFSLASPLFLYSSPLLYLCLLFLFSFTPLSFLFSPRRLRRRTALQKARTSRGSSIWICSELSTPRWPRGIYAIANAAFCRTSLSHLFTPPHLTRLLAMPCMTKHSPFHHLVVRLQGHGRAGKAGADSG
jgi:hypothetical protein